MPGGRYKKELRVIHNDVQKMLNAPYVHAKEEIASDFLFSTAYIAEIICHITDKRKLQYINDEHVIRAIYGRQRVRSR